MDNNDGVEDNDAVDANDEDKYKLGAIICFLAKFPHQQEYHQKINFLAAR